MLSFNEFVDIICKDIKEHLSKDYSDATVTIEEALTINKDYTGLCVRRADCHNTPVVNLSDAYVTYLKGESIDNILAWIAEMVETAHLDNVPDLSNWEKLKDRLYMRLSDPVANAAISGFAPHRMFNNLMITYHVSLNENMSAMVRNVQLQDFGLTEDMLYDQAIRNFRKMPESTPSFASMSKMLTGVAAADDPLNIASNLTMVYGAAIICYPGVLREMAEIAGGDYYLLPSSVHELIFVSKSLSCDPDTLFDLVSHINSHMVSKEDRLTDAVYEYDSLRDKLRLIHSR